MILREPQCCLEPPDGALYHIQLLACFRGLGKSTSGFMAFIYPYMIPLLPKGAQWEWGQPGLRRSHKAEQMFQSCGVSGWRRDTRHGVLEE